MRDPAPLEDPLWNYIVLGAAACFEGISLGIAWHQFRKAAQDKPMWKALHSSKDPTVFTVLAEDSAALAGLAVAALGVWASHRWNMPVLDGAASLVIGLLLAAVAVFLVYESRGLLIGEGVARDTADAIRQLVRAHEQVRDASRPLSMYIGRDEVLLTLDVQFKDQLSGDALVQAVACIERQVRERYPVIKRIYIEARKLSTRVAPT